MFFSKSDSIWLERIPDTIDSHSHDKGIPIIGVFWSQILTVEGTLKTELERLSNKFRDRNELEQLVKNASHVYGGALREQLKFLKDERVTAVLHEE